MKIFITCGKHPLKSSGGYATYTHALCKVFKKLGFDVHIIAISHEQTIKDSEIGTIHTITSKILPIESSTMITASFFLWSKSIEKYLNSLIELESDQCVIFGIGPWTLSGVKLKKKFGNKITLFGIFFTTITHETKWLMKGINVMDYGIKLKIKYSLIYYYSKLFLKKFEKNALDFCDKIIVHYDFTKRIIINEYNISEKKIEKLSYYTEIFAKDVLYSKYDAERKFSFTENKEFTCLSICRQEPRKGINYFLKAIQILVKKNIPIKAIIVGSGDLLTQNIQIAKKLGISNYVKFTGFVKDVGELYSKCDVFVQPSLQEGSGSVSVFEALQSKIPVITTYCDGLPEDIENLKSGILVPKQDELALANAILKIYNSPELKNKLVENGLKVIEEKCNAIYMTNSFKKLFQNLDFKSN